jgi:hypothetical protein
MEMKIVCNADEERRLLFLVVGLAATVPFTRRLMAGRAETLAGRPLEAIAYAMVIPFVLVFRLQ